MTHLRQTYFIVANTAILLLLVEVGAQVAMVTFDLVMSAVPADELPEPIKANYAHMVPADVDDLVRTTNSLRFRYEPVMGLLQQATTSKFVNVDAHGIRANGAVPRDIAAIQDAIWMLGGSTTFGFGVADHETIPAQLEVVMKRPVVNFGVSNFSSKEENLLFNKYLQIGYRPAMAMFLDGINESCESDLYQRELRILVDRAQEGYSWEFGKPVVYLGSGIARHLHQLLGLSKPREPQQMTCVTDGRQNELRTMLARTLAERDALCRLYRIECRTFVQPFAGVHGRHDDAAFLASIDANDLRNLFHHLEPVWRAAEVTFITDALDGYDRHAWVDEVHYSAAASRRIAEAIAKPVLYAAAKLGDKLKTAMRTDGPSPDGNPLICDRPDGPQALRAVHARLLAERDVFCRLYALQCTTFVQPFAGVHGRHDDLRLLPEPWRRQNRELFAHLEGNWQAARAVFVTDALDHLVAHAYVDALHYGKDASALIARAMAPHLRGPLRTTATTADPSSAVPAR
jgi:hypothetical protein